MQIFLFKNYFFFSEICLDPDKVKNFIMPKFCLTWFFMSHQQSFSYKGSCSRTQRSDTGEARTHGPSGSSQALYHWATALPIMPKYQPKWNIYDWYGSLFKLSHHIPQWWSASLDTEGPLVRASPASLHSVLEQDTLILAFYWFNPGRPVPT